MEQQLRSDEHELKKVVHTHEKSEPKPAPKETKKTIPAPPKPAPAKPAPPKQPAKAPVVQKPKPVVAKPAPVPKLESPRPHHTMAHEVVTATTVTPVKIEHTSLESPRPHHTIGHAITTTTTHEPVSHTTAHLVNPHVAHVVEPHAHAAAHASASKPKVIAHPRAVIDSHGLHHEVHHADPHHAPVTKVKDPHHTEVKAAIAHHVEPAHITDPTTKHYASHSPEPAHHAPVVGAPHSGPAHHPSIHHRRGHGPAEHSTASQHPHRFTPIHHGPGPKHAGKPVTKSIIEHHDPHGMIGLGSKTGSPTHKGHGHGHPDVKAPHEAPKVGTSYVVAPHAVSHHDVDPHVVSHHDVSPHVVAPHDVSPPLHHGPATVHHEIVTPTQHRAPHETPFEAPFAHKTVPVTDVKAAQHPEMITIHREAPHVVHHETPYLIDEHTVAKKHEAASSHPQVQMKHESTGKLVAQHPTAPEGPHTPHVVPEHHAPHHAPVHDSHPHHKTSPKGQPGPRVGLAHIEYTQYPEQVFVSHHDMDPAHHHMTSEYVHGHEYDTFHYDDEKHQQKHFTVTVPDHHDIVAKGAYFHAHPHDVTPSYPHDTLADVHHFYPEEVYPETHHSTVYAHEYNAGEEPVSNYEHVSGESTYNPSDWNEA